MATRYARETGRNWPRFNKPTDPQSIHGLALVRRSRPGSVARLTYYPDIRAKAFRPTLGALALPYLREQKLDQKFESYEVHFHSLLEHIEPVFFADVKVKLEKVTFIEGGSIDLNLKVSTTIEDTDDAPLLAAWRRGEVRVSLTPPDARPQAANDPEGAQSDAA